MSGVIPILRNFFIPFATALCVWLVLAFTAAYSARSSSHGTTYYACLYAGSLSQVGTTEPANCGRGTKISWTSVETLGPAGANTTNVRTGLISGSMLWGEDGILTNPNPGEYILSYPAGTFPFFDGAGVDNYPTITVMTRTGSTAPEWQTIEWQSDGSWIANIESDGVNTDFSFTITQHIPADATFSSAPFGAEPASITIPAGE